MMVRSGQDAASAEGVKRFTTKRGVDENYVDRPGGPWRTSRSGKGKFNPIAYLLEDFVAAAALTRSGAFEFMPVVAEPEG